MRRKRNDEREGGKGRGISGCHGRPVGHGALVQILELSGPLEPVCNLSPVACLLQRVCEGWIPLRIYPDRPAGWRPGRSLLRAGDARLPAQAGGGEAVRRIVLQILFLLFPLQQTQGREDGKGGGRRDEI